MVDPSTHKRTRLLSNPELSNATLNRAAALSSATLHEAAGRSGALPSAIKPLAPQMRVCGRALPVKCPPGDNLWIHRGLYAATPGDVLVVDISGGPEFGYWGEILTIASMVRRIEGIVINGGVRDCLRIIELRFPVFSSRTCIRGTVKNSGGKGHLGEPVLIGDVIVSRGDLVFGDADGVVIVPAATVDSVVNESEARDRKEQKILERLRAGETTMDIYGLPSLDSAIP